MALLPKIQNKDVYSFKDAQALINPSNVSSEKGKAISTDLYNRVYQAEKQSNEELLEQLKDLDIVRNVIEEVVPDEKERTELYAQYSALQRALEENSSSLNDFSKTITHSFMKKGLGKNGQFTQAQDILMSVGGGIKGELFPVFQGIIDQTSTFLKNRSDRKERVEEDIMKNIGSKPSSNNNTTEEEFSSERKNFSDVTNGENNTSILEHIDMNVDELLSKFKTEDGRIDEFKVESFLSELSEKFGEPLEAEAFGEAMRDILSIELSKLSSEQIKEFKDSMNSKKGNLLLEKSVSFDGYNEDEKSVIIDTLKEMMSSQADLLMTPKREMKDFTSLEAQEEYQRDSIKEQQRTATGIEKLCGILTGDKRKYSADGNSGGGIISNLIDSGKDLLLAKMGLDKFFGKDKASKGGAIKKTPGGLSSKGGGIFKKVGGWLTALGGGALLSGGETSDFGDVATDALIDTATDKVSDKGTDALKTAGKETVKDSAVKKSGKGIFGSVGKKIAKSLGGAGAKSLLKKIPGISILAGAGFGLSRLLEGDFTGALGELASGVAGTVPGMGTVVSTAIDAGLAARDISKETEEVVPQEEMKSGMFSGGKADDYTFEPQMKNVSFGGVGADDFLFGDLPSAPKVEVKPFKESILPDVDTITDIDHDYSQSSFDDVSSSNKSNIPTVTHYQQTKDDVTSKHSSIPILPETETITDIDHDYSQSSFDDVSTSSESNIPTVPPSQPTKDDVTPKSKEQLAEEERIFKEEFLFSNPLFRKDEELAKTLWNRKINLGNGKKTFGERYVKAYNKQDSNLLEELTYIFEDNYNREKMKKNKSKTSELTQHPSNSTKNDAYTSQPTKEDVTTTRNSNVSEYQNDDGTWMSNRQIKEKINYDERINNTSTQEELDSIYREKVKAERDRDIAYSKSILNYSNHTRSTWLGQVRAGTHEIHSSKEQQITQQPSNSTKNDAYTSQPTRTSVSEKKDTSTQKQETKQQPTVINNFNTTNNNVTQSAPQRSPQLLINPSGSYMGERQPTSR